MWLIEAYYWEKLRTANNFASDVPHALVDLLNCQTREEAERIYWHIDNVVVRQGSLFPAAVPTAAVLLEVIQRCAPEVRVIVMELLVQIVSGDTDPSEVDYGIDLKKLCLDELVHGLSIFLHWLEVGSIEEQYWCVDLAGMGAQHRFEVRQQTRTLLRRLRNETRETRLQELCDAWLGQLEG
jgi:hypothetical protein